MKKIYNIAAALLISSTVFGQRVNPTYLPAFQTVDIDEAYQTQLKLKQALQLSRINSKDPIDKARVSHADERIAAATTPLTGYVAPILPDSLATEHFNGGSARGVQIHAIGGILDPTSEDFVLINSAVSENDTFFVDSLHIGYAYNVVNPGITDTFRVQLFIADTTTGSSALNTLTIAAGLPNEGNPVKGIRFSSTMAHGVQTSATAPGITTADYIFSVNDTTSSLRYISIPIGIEVPKGRLFCWFGWFVPGQSWTAADNYFDQTGPNETMNAFMTFGRQEDPNADVLFAYDPTSYGSTHTLFNDGRYQIATTTFLNNTVPPGLSAINFVDYTYSANNSSVGIEEINTNNAILGNNYPNPFSDVTRINYTITNKTNVQLEVTDITGKVVLQMNEGTKVAGVYNIDLSADNFKSGIYYYSIITDSGKITKKMIVLE